MPLETCMRTSPTMPQRWSGISKYPTKVIHMPSSGLGRCTWAAQLDLDFAQRDLCIIYYEGLGIPKDYSKAMDWFLKSASQGCRNSLTYIGVMYYHVQGVPQYRLIALQWLLKASDLGNRSTMTDVGMMYCDGIGNPQDYEQAQLWFTKAATEDHSAAQRELGKMYLMGHGVPQNY
ncbi:hypothetical protein BGX24_003227 [Mortierella sp. AD032]|nr:hypothetical protein BGX24_003227 [Mortierella sp. AD032]